MANAVETIKIGKLFQKEFKNYPNQDRKMITEFIKHVYEFGFDGLEGLNKCSDDVSKNDPDFIKKVKYAIKYNLWHYHTGIRQFDTSKPFGCRTSEYVLHYQLLEDGKEVRIIDYSSHPPFKLPKQEYLEIE